jgi:hypothetical protein
MLSIQIRDTKSLTGLVGSLGRPQFFCGTNRRCQIAQLAILRNTVSTPWLGLMIVPLFFRNLSITHREAGGFPNTLIATRIGSKMSLPTICLDADLGPRSEGVNLDRDPSTWLSLCECDATMVQKYPARAA